MARLLWVSRSGENAWRKRPTVARDVANAALTEGIKAIHDDSRHTTGARRVHAELQDEFELRVARHRVARPIRLHGLQDVNRHNGRRRRGHLHEEHQDHVSGQFTREATDRVWVADVTQHRTEEGWLHLSIVLDVFHRHVVGWTLDGVLNTDLVLNAFQMAQQVRRPDPGPMHHTDQISPYGSLRFGRHLRASGVVGSTGQSGTPADNAVAESFFATLQTERLDRYDWPTREPLRTAIFESIEVLCNRRRRHSHLGPLSLAEFERRWHEQQALAQVTSP